VSELLLKACFSRRETTRRIGPVPRPGCFAFLQTDLHRQAVGLSGTPVFSLDVAIS
jgi:hypothetical protein